MSSNFSYRNWDCLYSFVCVCVCACVWTIYVYKCVYELYMCVWNIYITNFRFCEAFVYVCVHYVLVKVLQRNRANGLCSDTWKEIHNEELNHWVVESEKSCLARTRLETWELAVYFCPSLSCQELEFQRSSTGKDQCPALGAHPSPLPFPSVWAFNWLNYT